MLEPTAIHSYEPPAYRSQPASPTEGAPPSLPFSCVVLESADAHGGPSPSLLHSLRARGCRLILAQVESAPEAEGVPPTGVTEYTPNPLHREWFDAVFDKVIDVPAVDSRSLFQTRCPLERYFADADITPTQALCFACSEAGARVFAAVDAGLIIASSHDRVWRIRDSGICLPGADVAVRNVTVRQLAWLHEVFTQKSWCTCLWLTPPPETPEDSRAIRAELSTVSSWTMSARGHPPWARPYWLDGGAPACTVRLGLDEMAACPDWTPLVPLVRRGGVLEEVSKLPKVVLHCHSLDVGVAQVNHVLEVEDGAGLHVRMSGRRFVSLARSGQAVTEVSITILKASTKKLPEICIRSCLETAEVPTGFWLVEEPTVDIKDCVAELSATYINERQRTMTVKAWHRLVKDDGKGDVHVPFSRSAHPARVEVADGPCAVNFFFSNPHRGTCYTVEKGVTIYSVNSDPNTPCRLKRANSILPPLPDVQDALSMPEIEEEHRCAWRAEWDRADIEIDGTRKAIRCQRLTRLFRFHQAACGDVFGCGQRAARVPPLVHQLFQATMSDLCEDQIADYRPSSLLLSRLIVKDPRTPSIRIDPKVPPACQQMRFNAPLGGRWHRFTLTPGTVRILVQGPILVRSFAQLHGDTVATPPKFLIPSRASSAGVEVCATPWQEVQVQHALTDLGSPDGSTGGFYGVMCLTRFIRLEVLRRLWGDSDEDYRDKALLQPLESALASLQSAPRPPRWSADDDDDVHFLRGDATTHVRMCLAYEKNELSRDIMFLKDDDGDQVVEEMMRSQHEARFRSSEHGVPWVVPEIPAWDDAVGQAVERMQCAAAAAGDRVDTERPFRNFVTDRDGTTNNYCDRYASSVQSAYNAAWLSHFARHCTDHAVIISAAPLGGRPSAKGLMELSVTPRNVFTYTGSKGREYFNYSTQRVRVVEELSREHGELIEELHRRLHALCMEPGNTKFLGIGSGLQRKFGEVTMARNDPAGTVPEPESRRFMAAVRGVIDELEQDAIGLDMHDTGTDMEIFPRTSGGRSSFDKGDGIQCLDQKLQLHVSEGPNIICGDTSSDVAMIVAALRLMCGDRMVELWEARLQLEESENAGPMHAALSSTDVCDAPLDELTQEKNEMRAKEEADRRAKEERDEQEAREVGSRLAVIFVISPEQHRLTPKLAGRVRRWCQLGGAHCAIVPSPDVLIAALMRYANSVAGSSVAALSRVEKAGLLAS